MGWEGGLVRGGVGGGLVKGRVGEGGSCSKGWGREGYITRDFIIGFCD